MDTKANKGFGVEASRKHGIVDFHTTQMLSSHGCFGQYLQSLRNWMSHCRDCRKLTENAEHVLFRCGRWWRDGHALEVEVEESLDPHNIIGITLKKMSNWEAVKKFIGYVQPAKSECGERTRQ